jgi:hypothetical protein
MKRYYGGNPVPGGLYLNQHTLEFSQVTAENPRLPQPAEEKYVHLPTLAGIVLGAIFGLVFVMVLPLIGIAGLLFLAAYKAGLTRNNVGKKVFQLFMVQH